MASPRRIPAIGAALAKGLQDTLHWPFFRRLCAGPPLARPVKPDVAVVIYNDHGLSFFLDHIPTFAVGAAATYPNEDSGWGLEVLPDDARRRRALVASHRLARRRRVRHHDVPGDEGRSRLHGAAP